VRQLWDAKGSADLERMPVDRFATYAELCGAALARAHARSGDAVALAAYLGRSDTFDRSMEAFARRYADRNAEDFAALEAAADDGRIPATDVV
jgi:predicted alpha/beta hydrolase